MAVSVTQDVYNQIQLQHQTFDSSATSLQTSADYNRLLASQYQLILDDLQVITGE